MSIFRGNFGTMLIKIGSKEMNFEDKVAVITGSSAGIGAEAAKKITALGGRVTINYSKKNCGVRKWS